MLLFWFSSLQLRTYICLHMERQELVEQQLLNVKECGLDWGCGMFPKVPSPDSVEIVAYSSR